MKLFTNPREQLSVFERSVAKPRSVAIVATIVIGTGAVLDAIFGEQILTRFGASLTILAILALWYTFPVLDEIEVGQSLHKMFAQNYPNVVKNNNSVSKDIISIDATVPASITDPIIRLKIASSIYNLAKDTPEKLESFEGIRRSLIKAQVFWGGVGTFIWAFGDWIANLIFHCHALSCN